MQNTIHASALRNCRRATFYQQHNEPHSDPSLLNTAKRDTARDLAKAHLPIVLEAMQNSGWRIQTGHMPAYSDDFIPEHTVTDTIPAIGFHPEYTEGKLAVIYVQARTQAYIDAVQRYSTVTASRSLEARLAFAHLAAPNICDVDPTAPAVLATLNLDNHSLIIDLMYHHQSQSVNEQSRDWLSRVSQRQLPDADYRPESARCGRCPWRTTCHGNQEPATADDLPDDQFHTLEEYCEEYIPAYVATRQAAEAQKRRDKIRDSIKEKMVANGLTNFSYDGEQTVSVKITSTTPVKVDHEALKQFLTPEQYRQAVTYGKSDRINITVK